jgi:hypothetical protein
LVGVLLASPDNGILGVKGSELLQQEVNEHQAPPR